MTAPRPQSAATPSRSGPGRGTPRGSCRRRAWPRGRSRWGRSTRAPRSEATCWARGEGGPAEGWHMIRRWEFGNKRNRCKARPQQHARVERRWRGAGALRRERRRAGRAARAGAGARPATRGRERGIDPGRRGAGAPGATTWRSRGRAGCLRRFVCVDGRGLEPRGAGRWGKLQGGQQRSAFMGTASMLRDAAATGPLQGRPCAPDSTRERVWATDLARGRLGGAAAAPPRPSSCAAAIRRSGQHASRGPGSCSFRTLQMPAVLHCSRRLLLAHAGLQAAGRQ